MVRWGRAGEVKVKCVQLSRCVSPSRRPSERHAEPRRCAAPQLGLEGRARAPMAAGASRPKQVGALRLPWPASFLMESWKAGSGAQREPEGRGGIDWTAKVASRTLRYFGGSLPSFTYAAWG